MSDIECGKLEEYYLLDAILSITNRRIENETSRLNLLQSHPKKMTRVIS